MLILATVCGHSSKRIKGFKLGIKAFSLEDIRSPLPTSFSWDSVTFYFISIILFTTCSFLFIPHHFMKRFYTCILINKSPFVNIIFTVMSIGFNSNTYNTTETEGRVSVCVDVLNPADVGALQPFIIALIPEQGSNYVCQDQYLLNDNIYV